MSMDLDRRSFLQMLGMAGTYVVVPMGIAPTAEAVEPYKPLTITDPVLSVWHCGQWVDVLALSSLVFERQRPQRPIHGEQWVRWSIASIDPGTLDMSGRMPFDRHGILNKVMDDYAAVTKFRLSGDIFMSEFDGHLCKMTMSQGITERPDISAEMGNYAEIDLKIILAANPVFVGVDYASGEDLS